MCNTLGCMSTAVYTPGLALGWKPSLMNQSFCFTPSTCVAASSTWPRYLYLTKGEGGG